jgi:putative SOS response-associated peptidase YedK
MCARYSLTATAEELIEWFKLRKRLNIVPRYNIAPTQPVLVIRQDPDSGERVDDLMHWGLIPSWAKDPAIGHKMINARSETAAEKPSFRTALKRRRCILPVSGYYEWKAVEKRKQPYLIRVKDAPLMAIAGLWEVWNSPEGDRVQSCTLLTKDASESTRHIHDRMPVILAPDQYDAWLDAKQQDGAAVLKRIVPELDGELKAEPVSTYVNNPRHEGPECQEPAEEA